CCTALPTESIMATSRKVPPIPSLFKADTAVLSFSASKDGKVTVGYPGWDSNKVVLVGLRARVGPSDRGGHLWRSQGREKWRGVRSPMVEAVSYALKVAHADRAVEQ